VAPHDNTLAIGPVVLETTAASQDAPSGRNASVFGSWHVWLGTSSGAMVRETPFVLHFESKKIDYKVQARDKQKKKKKKKTTKRERFPQTGCAAVPAGGDLCSSKR
jgi:hypothetical protein